VIVSFMLMGEGGENPRVVPRQEGEGGGEKKGRQYCKQPKSGGRRQTVRPSLFTISFIKKTTPSSTLLA